MRRVAMFLCVCTLLLGGMISGQAQQYAISGDNNNLMDISLRDADLAKALTALFSTTGGRKQLKMNDGVNGRIARLQLTQTPFDSALDAMLGTDYSYRVTSNGDNAQLYTIYGRVSSDNSYSPKMPAFQAPSIGMASYDDTSTAGTATFGGGTTGGSSMLTWGSVGSASSDVTTATASAASETSVVKLIRVVNIDVALLATDYLGGEEIDLFELLNSGTYSDGSSNGSSSINNNDNNNNNNNNINNNDNNNRSNRSSRRSSRSNNNKNNNTD